jgi:ABC-type glycerol-3-phosphate transport system substrate-binding protein
MEFLSAATPVAAKIRLQAEMERFGRDKNQPPVSLVQADWENLWRELENVGIYRRGPDLAETGSTWLDSLVEKECLHSFSSGEIDSIGGKEVFFPAVWQNIASVNQKEIWGIPFRADARVIFYWKDIFEKASIDASAAFSTPENMTAAFEKLQGSGVSPWVVPTYNTNNTAFAVASWIWSAGGDFLSPDGKRTGFGSDATQRGMLAYFDLFRFMPHHAYPIAENDVTELFFTRQAAATIAGPWFINNLRQRKEGEKLLPHLGVALLPGPAFVGGTTLVVWKHCKDPSNAVEFIKRLISPEFQSEYCQLSGLLPVRQDLWTDEFINSHEYLPVFNQAIRTGRGLPPIAQWGTIEDRLSKTLGHIWENLYLMDAAQKPQEITRQMLAKHLVSLSAYLDTSLK